MYGGGGRHIYNHGIAYMYTIFGLILEILVPVKEIIQTVAC